MTRPARNIAILLAIASTTGTTTLAADQIKKGKWEFTVQMAAAPQASGAEAGMSHTACIDPANPVPSQSFGNLSCKLDNMQRSGSTVRWSMTCTPAQGSPVHADGVAHYSGDRMDGTVTAHLNGPSGQPIDKAGHITGRYLGACSAM